MITFSTCLYDLSSTKASFETYVAWMNNLLSIVNNFNLVVYVDEYSRDLIRVPEDNPRIRIIVFPIEHFFNYKYREEFIKNHERNHLLNDRVNWKVNMLWCEKISFVTKTKNDRIFESDFYGWCDGGYFRDRCNDTRLDELRSWPSHDKIRNLNRDKIHYACIQWNSHVERIVRHKNRVGLPKIEMPADQVSFGGGFFVAHKDKIDWWRGVFDDRIGLYFQHSYLVKDDQIILADIIYSDPSLFEIYHEHDPRYDNWFMFQRHFM